MKAFRLSAVKCSGWAWQRITQDLSAHHLGRGLASTCMKVVSQKGEIRQILWNEVVAVKMTLSFFYFFLKKNIFLFWEKKKSFSGKKKKKILNGPGVYEWLRGGEGAHEARFIDESGWSCGRIPEQRARKKTVVTATKKQAEKQRQQIHKQTKSCSRTNTLRHTLKCWSFGSDVTAGVVLRR